MKKTLETDQFVIYDDVLDNDNFQKLYIAVQQEEYTIPHFQKWEKVWRLGDNFTLGSKSYSSKNAPYNNHIDLMAFYFKEVSKLHTAITGDYNEMTLRCYLYNRDTKLNWHDDGGYLSAGIFYCHPYWASTWGGELMIAKTPEVNGSVPNPCLDHSFEDKFLEYYGYGQYITCKPNRLVLTKGGVWHSINRVDKDAGDHVRTSVVCFFTRS